MTINNKYSSSEIISEFEKTKKLYDSNIYNSEEYLTRKNEIINDLFKRDIEQKYEDFLINLIVLKEKGILEDDDITKLKEWSFSRQNEIKHLNKESVNDNNIRCTFCNTNIIANSASEKSGYAYCFACKKYTNITPSIKSEKNLDSINNNVIYKEQEKFINNKNLSSSNYRITTNKTSNKETREFQNIIIISGVFISILIIVIIISLSKVEDSKPIEKKSTETSEIDKKGDIKDKNTKVSFVSNMFTPDGVVIKFVESLGKQDWYTAYSLMVEKRRGNYSNFSSPKAYGGITKTTIYKCEYIGESNNRKEVIIDYESIDPDNRDGRFKQYFYLIPNGNSFLIVDIKNIDVKWY